MSEQQPKRMRYRCEIEPKCKGDERCARLPCPCGFWEAKAREQVKEMYDQADALTKENSQ